jgi:hypothetical protein
MQPRASWSVYLALYRIREEAVPHLSGTLSAVLNYIFQLIRCYLTHSRLVCYLFLP